MTRTQNIIAGINRVASCRKLQLCVGAVLSAFFAIRSAGANLSDDAKVKLWLGFLGAAVVLVREVINAWTEQDVATINNQTTPAPDVAVTSPILRSPQELRAAASAIENMDLSATGALVSSINPPKQVKPAAPAMAPVASKPASAPTTAAAQRPPVNMPPMSSAQRLPPRTVLPPRQI